MGNVKNKTIVITGASDGIGAAAARQLHADGAKVVLVGRSESKTKAIADELKADYYLVDFAHLNQVKPLAVALLKNYKTIDVLANNAGLIWNKRTVTGDGHELTFQVNHLGPFLLTQLLKEKLIKSKATIITTASAASMAGRIDLYNLENEQNYGAFRAYADSKLANVLFTREIDRLWGPDGVAAAAFHPGVVASGFGKNSNKFFDFAYNLPFSKYFLATPEKGADTLVWLASTVPGKDWKPGQYYAKRKQALAHKQADDQALVSAFWDASNQMIQKYL